MFNLSPAHVYSAITYDDNIANNAGCHTNSETLSANTHRVGLSVLNAKGSIIVVIGKQVLKVCSFLSMECFMLIAATFTNDMLTNDQRKMSKNMNCLKIFCVLK